ncbi:hypothetical protein [Nitrosospira sp. Nsp2]|uniref:hypothetical protein n=1 Tax=Nitrosospira sp. Nsp2 TaxID=136548 RepID=UPI000D32403F|nr:hypothetical protein [Nitrosospira sp. Nsp2]
MAMSLWKLWSAVLVSSRDWNARRLMGIIQFLVEVASKESEYLDLRSSGESDVQVDQLEFVLYYERLKNR